MSLHSSVDDKGKYWAGCDIMCLFVALRVNLKMLIDKMEQEGDDSVNVLCADTFEATGGRPHSDPMVMYSLAECTLRAMEHIEARMDGRIKAWNKHDYEEGKKVCVTTDQRVGYEPPTAEQIEKIRTMNGTTTDDEEEGEEEGEEEAEEEEEEQEQAEEKEEDQEEDDDDYLIEEEEEDEEEEDEEDEDEDEQEGEEHSEVALKKTSKKAFNKTSKKRDVSESSEQEDEDDEADEDEEARDDAEDAEGSGRNLLMHPKKKAKQ